MQEANSSDYLIRLMDQTDTQKKVLYACITKEQSDKINELLGVEEYARAVQISNEEFCPQKVNSSDYLIRLMDQTDTHKKVL